MLYKNRLIFGLIWGIIKLAFKTVYFVLHLVNLELTALLGVIGIILYFTGAFDASNTLKIIFLVLFIITIVYAIGMTLKKILSPFFRKKERGGVQIVNRETENKEDVKYRKRKARQLEEENLGLSSDEFEAVGEDEPQTVYQVQPVYKEEVYPKFYAVKGREGYYMGEYKDKYVLYRKEGKNYIAIRTDYK